MIRCQANPAGMLKAAILSELTGRFPCLQINCRQSDLFSPAEEIEADSFAFPVLLKDLAKKTGNDYSWLGHYQGRRLAVMILFNLRNRFHNNAKVIFAALSEALRHGPSYCIFCRGRASSIFRRHSREVGTEIHRMMGLVRFSVTNECDLVARPRLYHNTADILLRKFQLRYPSQRLIFFLPGGALSCEQGLLNEIPVQDFPAAILNQTDDFASLWETYYRSQYIPARKNIRLASHFIPKKYWDWLPEGKILEQEAKK